MAAPIAPQAPVAPVAPQAPVAPAAPVAVAAPAAPVAPQQPVYAADPGAQVAAAPVQPVAPAPAPPVAVAPAPPVAVAPVAAPQMAPVAAPVAQAPAPAPAMAPILPAGGGDAFSNSIAAVDYNTIDDSGGLVPSHYTKQDGTQGDKIVYEAIIQDIKQSTTEKGSPMATVKLVITYPPHGRGVALYDNLIAQENTQWKVKSFFKALGLIDPSGRVTVPITQTIGRVVAFTTTQDEYNNVTRSKVAGTFQVATQTPVG